MIPVTYMSFRSGYRQYLIILFDGMQVNLAIYNLRGQKIYTLAEGKFDAGIHSVDWNASDVSSGVYFARLVAGSETKSLKMSLLK